VPFRALTCVTAAAIVALGACGDEREPVADPDPPATAPAEEDVAAAAPADLSAWCSAAELLQEAALAMDTIDPTDPDAVEAAITRMIDRTVDAAPLAPDEISEDVATSLATLRLLDAALIDVDYEIVRADLTAVVAGGGSADADDRIAAFNAEHCGFPDRTADGDAAGEVADAAGGDGEVDDGEVFDPADGPLRDQSIALLVEEGFTEEEAGCIFDNIDLTDPDLANDEERLLELVVTCDLDVERLSGLDG
jgi:hypothetical protein